MGEMGSKVGGATPGFEPGTSCMRFRSRSHYATGPPCMFSTSPTPTNLLANVKMKIRTFFRSEENREPDDSQLVLPSHASEREELDRGMWRGEFLRRAPSLELRLGFLGLNGGR